MPQTLDSIGIAWSVAATANSPADFTTAKAALSYSKSFGWTTGAGASQADRCFADQRTLAASANEDLDLNGTALQDILGQNLALARVKALGIWAASANPATLVVGAAAANGWVGPFGASTHTLAVPPGGSLLLTAPTAAGWPVTAATADLLRITAGAGGNHVYDIVILGSST